MNSRTKKSAALLIAVLLLVWTAPLQVAVSQGPKPCAHAEKYEIAEFGIQRDPLLLQSIRGRAVIQGYNGQIVVGLVPRDVCLSLFLANSHKFVSSASASKKRKFDFGAVKPGKYRLVARAEGFCTGNIPLEVLPSGDKAGHTRMVILFRSAALDVCTSADYAR